MVPQTEAKSSFEGTVTIARERSPSPAFASRQLTQQRTPPTVVSALPIFYQGWGGREAIVVATIGGVGQVTNAEAIALSIAFGIVIFLASLPGAVVWIMQPSMGAAARM